MSRRRYYHDLYPAYVPVAERRARAQKKMQALRRKGYDITPIEAFRGNRIARTFWGRAWCEHLESFSDFSNRLPRGRTYVRNGSVCHLAIGPGRVEAFVMGSDLYTVNIGMDTLPAARWESIARRCSGKIGSLLELLQGKLSNEVMGIVTDRDSGLFPDPDEIHLACDCPDFAGMCKHLAAVLYGVGVRLDSEPELLFLLRDVDHRQLTTDGFGDTLEQDRPGSRRRLAGDNLADVFGIDIDSSEPDEGNAPSPQPLAPGRRPTGRSSKPKVKTRPKKRGEKGNTAARLSPRTGTDVRRLRYSLVMTEQQFGRLVGVSAATIRRWETAGPIEHHARQANQKALDAAASLDRETAHRAIEDLF